MTQRPVSIFSFFVEHAKQIPEFELKEEQSDSMQILALADDVNVCNV